MSAIVCLLWPKNAGALALFARSAAPATYYVPGAPEVWRNALRDAPVESLDGILSNAERAAVTADAARRAETARATLDTEKWGDVANAVEPRLRQAATAVAALDVLHAREGVDEILLNEDVTLVSKTAALWAQTRGVPSVVLSHSCILGRLYTVHREANADTIAVFGNVGAAPYEELQAGRSRLAVTGNPAWDGYPALVRDRASIRATFAKRHGFDGHDRLVVFATTWTANLTAFCDAGVYEVTLRAAMRAARHLRDQGTSLRLVVKDRPSNRDKAAFVAALAREESVADSVTFTYDDTERWIAAADAVVSVDSNVSIEAAIAGVPAINVWTPLSWLNGPFFGAHDGVVDADEETLTSALEGALNGSEESRAALQESRKRLEALAANVGSASVRAAELFARSRKVVRPMTRYVWEELSSPRTVEERGALPSYNHHPRVELLDLLSHHPRTVLDVGCAAGATGAELKRRYPNATVHGVELNPEAASIARGVLDRVLVESIETMDFAAHGFEEGSIDAVFFPDVLEHLYDPWNTLRRVAPFLSADAQVLASIPNVRNLWLLMQLLSGKWQYTQEGLLDVTHIRFFTRASVCELFEQTGYKIERWGATIDPRVPVGSPAPGTEIGATFNVDTATALFKNLSVADLEEMRTLQFLVDASPILVDPLTTPASRATVLAVR